MADIGNTTTMGRPRKYTDIDTLQAAIDAYFDSLESKDDKGAKPPTANGLARALGFLDRKSLWNYDQNPEFSPLIKDARQRVRTFWEERLAGTAATGAIFWLKNNDDFRDAHEISGPDGGPIITAQEMSIEDRAKWLEEHGYQCSGR